MARKSACRKKTLASFKTKKIDVKLRGRSKSSGDVEIKLTPGRIDLKPRKLKARWSLVSNQPLSVTAGSMIEDQLTQHMAEQIAKDLDNRLLTGMEEWADMIWRDKMLKRAKKKGLEREARIGLILRED